MSSSNSRYGNFSDDFTTQLNTISSKNPQKTTIQFILKIPNGFRYHYTDFSFIYSELRLALQKRYPLGFEIINLIPSPHDDHYIQITLRIQIR